VRYIGLENLMRMRQEAKQGLAQMEAMGQMGNGDEAVMPDDLPFDMYDLDIDNEEEYNSETRNYQVGGYVAPTVPTNPYSQPGQVNPQTGTYTLPGTGIAGYQVPTGGQTGYTPYGGAAPYFQPVQFTGPQFQTALQTTNLPTFAETVGSKPGQYDELRTYINDAGQTLQIPFKDGKPIYPIPEGYRPIGDQPAPEEAPTTVTPTVGQAQVRDDGGTGADGKSPGASVGWGGTTEGAKPGLKVGSTPVEISYDTGTMPSTLGALGFIGSLVTGKDVPDGVTVGMSLGGVKTEMPAEAFNTAKKASFMGSYSDTLLDVAKTNVAAVDVLKNKYGVTTYDYTNQTLNEIAGRAAKSDAAIQEMADFYGFDIDDVADNPFGFGKNYNDAIAKAVEVANSPQTYVDANGITQTFTPTSKFSADDIKAGHTARTAINARNEALEAIAKAKNASGEQTSAQKEQAKQDAALAASGAAKGSGMKSEAEATAQSEAFERSQDDGGGRGPGGGSEAGDPSGGAGLGSGTDCLTENMKVKLNGVIDFVTNIKVGDMIDGCVVKEVLHKHMRSGYFVINNELEITNDHPLLANGTWTKPEELYIGDYINNVKVASIEYIDRMTPTVSIVIDGDSFDVYTEGSTYTVHGRYREVRQQAA
jgi:hypothetical protein